MNLNLPHPKLIVLTTVVIWIIAVGAMKFNLREATGVFPITVGLLCTLGSLKALLEDHHPFKISIQIMLSVYRERT